MSTSQEILLGTLESLTQQAQEGTLPMVDTLAVGVLLLGKPDDDIETVTERAQQFANTVAAPQQQSK